MITPKQLGQTDLYLSPIGLGTWQFSNSHGTWKTVTDDLVYQIMKTTLTQGVNWIDTAEIYGNGISESFVGRTLNRLEDEKVLEKGSTMIADKWWPAFRFASSISRTINQRLAYLERPVIDLYQIHRPNSLSSLQKQIEEMAKLVEAGLIRHVGVSNFSAKEMELAHNYLKEYGLTLASNQVKYNLLDRSPETNGVLETAQRLGISIIAYSPLQQGLLTGRFHSDKTAYKQVSLSRRLSSHIHPRYLEKTRPLMQCIQELATAYDCTPAHIALNWLISHPKASIFAIPGASSVKQGESNVKPCNFSFHKKIGKHSVKFLLIYPNLIKQKTLSKS
nr:aldo/keto reductase [Streptococcus ovis]